MAKEYKSIIKYSGGSLEFFSNRWADWDSFKVELKRSATYKGLVSSFTNTITYVKNIRDRMVILLDSEGINTDAELTISISNKNGDRNSYQKVGDSQSFSLDFSKAEVTETSISLNAEDSSFANKFFARHKEKINFDTTTNLDGGVMSDYKVDLDTITLHDRTILFDSLLSLKETTNYPSTSQLNNFIYLPLNVDYKSDDNFKFVIANYSNDRTLADSIFYLQSDRKRVLDLSIKIDVDLTIAIPGLVPSIDLTLNYIIYDSDFNTKVNETLGTNNYPNTGINTRNYTHYSDRQITLEEGDSIQLGFIVVQGDRSFLPLTITPNKLSVSGISTEYYEKTTAECIKPLIAFRRLIEAITGEENAVYSEVFGLQSDGYEQDGEWANLVTLNGKMIRGFNFEDNPYNVTFEDLFKYYNAITPLALTIETIGGKQRVRIEKYEDIFENGIILELGSEINNLVRRVREDSLFTTIIAGYKDQLYEEVNGLDSAHGESNYTTPLTPKDKKYDILCKARTGGYDIHFPRIQQFADDPTLDTRYDKDNYLIDAYIVSGNLIARKDELFQSVTGIFNPQYAYNLRLLPSRNVRRHGGVIKESLTVNNNDLLVYTKGSNNLNVTSQLLTESEPVIENEDIKISDLQRPKVLSELLSFNTPLTLTEYNLINLNKNKLITFVDIGGNELSGYVDSLKFDEPKGEAEIVLIRANK